MQVTLEKLPKSMVKLTIELSAEKFAEGMGTAYRRTVGRLNVPGFRRGKAPRKVVENFYGESVFYEEAFNALCPEAYDKAVEQEKLQTVSRPDLDIVQIGSGKPFIFTAEVAVRPEVTLASLDGIEAQQSVYPVTDADVDAEIEKAREKVSTFESVERAVENGDKVELDYAGSVDSVPFQGGTAQGQTLTIGSGQFIPGFEEQMIGMQVGEERDLNIKFPAEYHSEDLAGKDAVFHVKVNGIQVKVLPALDDEFAKDVSEFETLDAYRADVRRKLSEQNDKRAADEFENALVEALCERATVEIPDAMISSEMDDQMRMMTYRFQMQGLQLEQFLAYTGQTAEQYREQFRPRAEQSVKAQLALAQLQKEQDIQVDDESMDKEIARMAEQLGRSFDEYKADLHDHDTEYLRNTVLANKTIEYLKSRAVAPAAKPAKPAKEVKEPKAKKTARKESETAE